MNDRVRRYGRLLIRMRSLISKSVAGRKDASQGREQKPFRVEAIKRQVDGTPPLRGRF